MSYVMCLQRISTQARYEGTRCIPRSVKIHDPRYQFNPSIPPFHPAIPPSPEQLPLRKESMDIFRNSPSKLNPRANHSPPNSNVMRISRDSGHFSSPVSMPSSLIGREGSIGTFQSCSLDVPLVSK